MENQFTTSRAALALCCIAVLAGCTTAPVPVLEKPSLIKPAQLAITQVGFGPTARYVYCEVGDCPAPTVKTLAGAAPQTVQKSQVFLPKRLIALEISFPFNSSRMRESDKKLLAEAASTFAGGDIEIIARSDFVGPKEGQRKVVNARAKVMRAIVAKQAQGARIIERREVADPTPVAKAEQAQQRRGSVRFSPIDVTLKGTPK